MEYFLLDQAQAKRDRLRAESAQEALVQEARKAPSKQSRWLHPRNLLCWLLRAVTP
jgi:hypothetical protein